MAEFSLKQPRGGQHEIGEIGIWAAEIKVILDRSRCSHWTMLSLWGAAAGRAPSLRFGV
jgi:hypothetical protein